MGCSKNAWLLVAIGIELELGIVSKVAFLLGAIEEAESSERTGIAKVLRKRKDEEGSNARRF